MSPVRLTEIYTLINVYVPDRANERVGFLTNLELRLSTFTIEGTILLEGDFNFVFNLERDRTGGTPTSEHTRGSVTLRPLLDKIVFVDAWLATKPKNQQYTYFNTNGSIRSRLDRFHVEKSMVEPGFSTYTIPTHFSDHDAIAVKFMPKTSTKSPYWKLNVSVLADPEYKNRIEGFWRNWKSEKHSLPPDQWWDIGKIKICQESQSFCRKRNLKHQKRVSDLTSKLCQEQKKLTPD